MRRSGIILAAGIGSRLKFSNKTMPIKPLAEVDDLALLERTVNSLEVADVDRVIVVLGWKAQEIQKQICDRYKGPVSLDFAFNDQYCLQNGVSVLCARGFIRGEFILTMADHILDEEIMYLVRDHRPPEGGATLCVDYKLETIFDIDDSTKVLAEDSLIRKIGKKLKSYNCIDTGVFIGTDGLVEAIDSIYKQKGDASLSEGVQLLANGGLMEILDIKDAFWQDVDNLDMLLHAEKLLNRNARGTNRSECN